MSREKLWQIFFLIFLLILERLISPHLSSVAIKQTLTQFFSPSSLLICRLFGTKCEKCTRSFAASDFVMRAKNKIFHLECFRCVACDKQLVHGDEFALRPDGLFCKEDHSAGSLGPLHLEENNNNDHTDDLEQDIDDQSQDDEKDLLLLDDRFADSGMLKDE